MSRIVGILLTMLTVGSGAASSCAPSSVPPPASLSTPGPAGSQRAAWEVEWDRTVAGAKKEGKLMIYSTPSGSVMRELGDAFKEKFGVAVDFVVGRGEELPRRIEMERQAGIRVADVIISGPTTLVTSMKPSGLLQKLEPLLLLPEVKDPSAWITGTVPFLDKDLMTIGMIATYQRYVFTNTDMVKEGEITSYQDLLNPRWKAKIVLDDPSVSGTGAGFAVLLAVHVLGMEEAKDFLRQLARQEPVIIREKRLLGEWVARGKYPVGIGVDREVAADFLRVGAPVAFAKVKEGTTLGTAGGGLGVVANAPHPEATRVFVNWVLSREGNAKFVKLYGSPGSRRDAPREGIPAMMFPEPGEKAYLETEELHLARRNMTNVAREIFSDLLR